MKYFYTPMILGLTIILSSSIAMEGGEAEQSHAEEELTSDDSASPADDPSDIQTLPSDIFEEMLNEEKLSDKDLAALSQTNTKMYKKVKPTLDQKFLKIIKEELVFNVDEESEIKRLNAYLHKAALMGVSLSIDLGHITKAGLQNLKNMAQKYKFKSKDDPQSFDQITSLKIEGKVEGLVNFICSEDGFKQLISLNLLNAYIGTIGAQIIAQSKQMSNLTSLNLEYNKLLHYVEKT